MTLMSTNAARDTIMHTIEKPSVQQDLGMPAEGALAWDPVDSMPCLILVVATSSAAHALLELPGSARFLFFWASRCSFVQTSNPSKLRVRRTSLTSTLRYVPESWRINGSKTQILREIQVRPSAERSEPRAHRVIDIQSLQARTTSQYESAGHSPDTLPDTPIGMRTFDTRDIPDEELAAVYTAEAGRPSRGNRRSGHWQGNPLYSSHTVQQRQGQQQMQDDPESPYRPPLRPPTPDGMYR